MRNVTRVILPAILLLSSIPAVAGTLVTDLTPWEEVEGTLVLEGDVIRYDAIRRNEDGTVEVRTPEGRIFIVDKEDIEVNADTVG